jgi:hypothetical protein
MMAGEKAGGQVDEAEALVEEVMKRYVGLLPPEELELARSIALSALKTHPTGKALLARIQEPAVPDASGTKPKDGAAENEAADRKAGGGVK